MTSNFTRGQAVRIAYNGQQINGTVELASSNGRSLLLDFDGGLYTPGGGLYVGHLALLLDDQGVYRDLAENAAATVSPLDSH